MKISKISMRVTATQVLQVPNGADLLGVATPRGCGAEPDLIVLSESGVEYEERGFLIVSVGKDLPAADELAIQMAIDGEVTTRYVDIFDLGSKSYVLFEVMGREATKPSLTEFEVAVLAKVNEEGEDSLSKQEKAALTKAKKKLETVE